MWPDQAADDPQVKDRADTYHASRDKIEDILKTHLPEDDRVTPGNPTLNTDEMDLINMYRLLPAAKKQTVLNDVAAKLLLRAQVLAKRQNLRSIKSE